MYRVVFFSVPFAIVMFASPGSAFESALFPGEGPIRIRASGDEMVLRKAPMAYAGIADTIWLAQGEIIKWSNARFRTVVPGLLLVSEDCAIDGSRYGRVFYLSIMDYYRGSGKWETFRFSKRDTIEYLQYRAEGYAFLRMDGTVISAELLSPKSAALREIRSPQLELWIEVEDKDGKPLGWFRLGDDFVHRQTRAIMFPSPEFLHSQ